MFIKKNGQSLMEYAILFSVVAAALLIMQFYVKRAYQGRIKQDADEVGQQYSPGHTASSIYTNTMATSTTCIGGNCFGQDIPMGMTVTSGSTSTTMRKREGVDSFASER
ncbi:MAG: hypothetical protein WC532_08775 [Candidatus Omnitrophota bacterium]